MKCCRIGEVMLTIHFVFDVAVNVTKIREL